MAVLRMRPHRRSTERQVGSDNRTRERGGIEVENKMTATVDHQDHGRIVTIPEIRVRLVGSLPCGVWVPVGVHVRNPYDRGSEVGVCLLRSHSYQVSAL